jgi:hypothetical protein
MCFYSVARNAGGRLRPHARARKRTWRMLMRTGSILIAIVDGQVTLLA